jgi:hypothetical protein
MARKIEARILEAAGAGPRDATPAAVDGASWAGANVANGSNGSNGGNGAAAGAAGIAPAAERAA